ncbi:MAG: hypothetical protein OXT68_03330 [Chloroflexota bacterium]|nr:hypothetical protein [Chloroflexota bacterium]
MPSQAKLYQNLRAASTAKERRDLALQLLARTNSRQYLDECLRVLKSSAVVAALDESHRPILRDKCFSLFAAGKRDKSGILRESITRLLVHIAHPDDIDLYQLGVETYYLQPVDDVAQNLRAVALAGMTPIDPALACLYATRFLSEPFTSVFNCEPALTAIDALVAANQRLPIYQFLLHSGEGMARTGRGELTGKALESLGEDFPPHLYGQLIEQYQAIDQPTASMGIINWVIERRAEGLYDRLESVIMRSKDVDLRRYGLVMMAAARDDELSERLLGLARLARTDDIPLFIEALGICQHQERDTTLALLRRRAGSR